MTSMGNVRAAGCDLLLDLFSCAAGESKRAELYRALVGALCAPLGAAAPGGAAHWRRSEVALLSICCCAEPLLEHAAAGADGSPALFDGSALLGALLTLVGTGATGGAARAAPFLHGRAVRCIAALLPAATEAHLGAIVACALDSFESSNALPVRICGCRAFYSLLTKVRGIVLYCLFTSVCAHSFVALLSQSSRSRTSATSRSARSTQARRRTARAVAARASPRSLGSSTMPGRASFIS